MSSEASDGSDDAGGMQPGVGPSGDGDDALQRPCTQPLGLLDMPAPWLEQLPGHIERDEDGLLPLLQTCRFMRDLVLSQFPCKLCFILPIPEDGAGAAQARLLLACKYGRVELTMFSNGLYQQRVTAASSASSLLHGTMASLGHGLDAITSVELQELELNTVVPGWLALTCPNMTRLVMPKCTISSLPPLTTTLPVYGRLQHLHLDPPLHRQAWKKQWEHQLRALTGLTSLEVGGVPRHGNLPAWFMRCCADTVGSQLTLLSWRGGPDTDLSHLQPRWFPNLTELQLNYLDDEGMEAVLSLQLKRLLCNRFQLESSYTHHPCTWQHLGFEYLNIPAFDHMPLEGLQSMQCIAGLEGGVFAAPHGLTIIPCPKGHDLGASSRVAAVVGRCGGVAGATRLQLGSDEDYQLGGDPIEVSSASAAAAMAIVGSCKASTHFIVYSILASAELVAAIKQHLPSTQVTEISFKGCSFMSEALPPLLPSLPRSVRKVHLVMDDDDLWMTEAEVMLICLYATRCITMKVDRDANWHDEWQQRTQAAMAAAGHQHVLLEGE